jgi:colanic acid/amylovoran biosynthesis glycosyltransferase
MTLAVFTTDLGASFIDLHLSDLSPGRTIAVGSYGPPEFGNIWKASCPVLRLDLWASRLSVRLAKRAGLSEVTLRDAVVSRFLKRHGVKVVLGEYLDQFLSFVPLMDRLKLPYVVQGHGTDVSAALRKRGMADRYLAYRSARAILTRSAFHRERLIGIGLPAPRIHVNPGGVHVPATPPARGPEASRRILAVGRMVDKKGPIYLLEAFRRAASQDTALTLDYVGAGPLFAAARQFVDACGLTGRVRLHGVAPEERKQQLLRDCGVFAQHSLTDPATGDEEGLPAAIQEAMANGMAVVSTRHAGIPEAVVEGRTGLLVDEGDVDGMARALLQVVPTAADMGRSGHTEALARHDWRHERDRLKHWLFSSR